MKLTETQIAWLAGLFDGEGNVYSDYRPSKSTGALLVITIAMTHKVTIDKVQQLWPGKIYKREPKSDKHKVVWIWKLHKSSEGVQFLETLWPYLVTKSDQANWGIRLGSKASYQGKVIGVTDRAERCYMKEQLRILNKRGG